ncbi:MAG: squalene/phytoene synthase family protein [Methanotrichaceae archaeon]|nr:squalene/phytoene synthase family protein [Methanotrichaceae archaeon]MDD1758527.1 squalene/phytoene synthase family protein [Methanotrichaceae archaeon]
MQLNNFWRGISSDWRIGRAYIPQEDMERFGYSESDLAARRINPKLIDLLEFEFERTGSYYDIARQSVKSLANGNWAVMSVLEIYRGIMTSIRRNHYDVFSQRAGPGYVRKIGLAFKSYGTCGNPDSMEHTRDGFNLYGFLQRAFPALLGWALGSMAPGILWMRNQNGTVVGFGSQFAGWRAINAILAAFCLRSAKRNLAQPGRGRLALRSSSDK